MFGRRAFVVTLGLIVATAIVFAWFPELDLAAARLFGTAGGFILNRDRDLISLRQVGLVAPMVAAGVCVLALLWPAFRPGVRLFTDARNLVAILLTFTLGPGLLVNVGLKDHWHRPRPVQVQEFGGPSEFRPWWDTSGACVRNCSFVSGEVAGATAMVLVAAVMPVEMAGSAIIVALIFAVGVALLRMAFGGHFLSDVIFAALLTHLVAILVFALMRDERWRLGRAGQLEEMVGGFGSRLRARWGCL